MMFAKSKSNRPRRIRSAVKRRLLCSRGQSPVELALMFPFLLLFLFIVVEYSNLYIHSHRASTFSREAAMIIYQECRDLPTTSIQSCVQSNLRNSPVNTVVIVSAWAPDPNTGVMTRYALEGETLEYQTRYDETNLADVWDSGNEFTAIAEFYEPYSHLTPLGVVGNIFLEVGIPEVIYESTVI